jgi:hypothetical protein
VPSLIACDSLEIYGSVCFDDGVVIAGNVEIHNASDVVRIIPAGTYRDQVLE